MDNSVISVTIQTGTQNPTAPVFNVPLLVGYIPSTIQAARVAQYAKLSDLTAIGIPTNHALYRMAQALLEENPSVPNFKIGRKALPSVQTLALTPIDYQGAGVAPQGSVLSVEVNGTIVTYTILAGATQNSVATALQALLAPIVGVKAVDSTGFITLTPSRVASVPIVAVASDNHTFIVTIEGVAYTYTSGTGATCTQITAGLQSLISAALGSAVTIAITTTSTTNDTITLTFKSPVGADVRVSGTGSLTIGTTVSSNDLLQVGMLSYGFTLKDNTPDPGIATDLTAIWAFDTAHYGVGLDSQSSAEIQAAAAYFQTQTTLFAADNIDTDKKVTGNTASVAYKLGPNGHAYGRTFIMHAEYSGNYQALGWLGGQLPFPPGSRDFAFKVITAGTPSPLNPTDIAALEAQKCNYYFEYAGLPSTRWGWLCSGQFIDVQWGTDWFVATLQLNLYTVRINAGKIPWDTAGDLAYAQILAMFGIAQKQGVVAPNVPATPGNPGTPWIITVPDPSSASPATRATRIYPPITFSAFLAGSVNRLQLVGALQ